MRKKAQAKMMETIMVLVVFFILLMLGLGFYAYTRITTLEREVSDVTDLESIEVAQAVNYLPELKCFRQGIVIENCIDLYKARAFSQLMNQSTENKLDYFDQLAHSKIQLKGIYPNEAQPKETLLLYNNSKRIMLAATCFFKKDKNKACNFITDLTQMKISKTTSF